MERKCPACGWEVKDGADRCPSCGLLASEFHSYTPGRKKEKSSGCLLPIGIVVAVLIAVIFINGALNQHYGGSTSSQSRTAVTAAPSPTPKSTVRIGKQNALAAAKLYLNSSAFSRSGLIDQLKYEGYTDDEAAYAVGHCGANWEEQAVRMAKQYLDTMPFSKSSLIEQLEYEGFTHEQAVYGVEQNGY